MLSAILAATLQFTTPSFGAGDSCEDDTLQAQNITHVLLYQHRCATPGQRDSIRAKTTVTAHSETLIVPDHECVTYEIRARNAAGKIGCPAYITVGIPPVDVGPAPCDDGSIGRRVVTEWFDLRGARIDRPSVSGVYFVRERGRCARGPRVIRVVR